MIVSPNSIPILTGQVSTFSSLLSQFLFTCSLHIFKNVSIAVIYSLFLFVLRSVCFFNSFSLEF